MQTSQGDLRFAVCMKGFLLPPGGAQIAFGPLEAGVSFTVVLFLEDGTRTHAFWLRQHGATVKS